MKQLILIPCLVLLFLAGCASHGFIPAVSYDIRGSIQDNHYTSPNGTFRVRVPTLLKPGAKIKDWTPATGVWIVLFSDDLCREYDISERPGDLKGLSIEKHVDQTFPPFQKDSQVSLLERKTVQTRHGPAVFLRYRHLEKAPCVTTRMSGGKKVVTKHDAEVGQYILNTNGYFYHLIYVLGVNPEGDAVLTFEPLVGNTWEVENILSEFLEGFEILRTTQK